MRTHTVKTSSAALATISRLRSDYDFYMLYTPFMRECDMFDYYLPRLLQTSKKGQQATRSELLEVIKQNIDKHTRCHNPVEIREGLLAYISKSRKSPEVVATVRQVSTHPDLRTALCISDTIHFTTCLSTGLLPYVKGMCEQGTPETCTLLLDKYATEYLSQVFDESIPFMSMFNHGDRGVNAVYVPHEVTAYKLGHVVYVTTGNPIYEDGEGYTARLRLHKASTKDGQVYWIAEDVYGIATHSEVLYTAALAFAGEGRLLVTHRKTHKCYAYEGKSLNYLNASTYKDTAPYDLDCFDEGEVSDELYVMTSQVYRSRTVSCITSHRSSVLSSRKKQHNSVRYTDLISVQNFTTLALSFNFHYSYTTKDYSVNKYLEQLRAYTRCTINLPDCHYLTPSNMWCSSEYKYARTHLTLLYNHLFGYPVQRDIYNKLTWVYDKVAPSPVTGKCCGVRYGTYAHLYRHLRDHIYTCVDPTSVPKRLLDDTYIGTSVIERHGLLSFSYTLYYRCSSMLSGDFTPVSIELDDSVFRLSQLTTVNRYMSYEEGRDLLMRLLNVHNMPELYVSGESSDTREQQSTLF